MKKTVLGLAIVAAAGFTGAANAAPVAVSGQFTMYSQAGLDTSGAIPGGSLVAVDNTVTGFVDQIAGTWGVSSTTPFYGLNWTASGGKLIQTAGTYALDTATGIVSSIAGPCAVADDGSMCFAVGANQLAGTIDFAWGVNTGIRVVNVWNTSPGGGLTAAVVPGMENGSTIGFNAAFDLAPVPLPGAVWLLGSGLLGLAGVARRRKSQC